MRQSDWSGVEWSETPSYAEANEKQVKIKKSKCRIYSSIFDKSRGVDYACTNIQFSLRQSAINNQARSTNGSGDYERGGAVR